MGVGARVRGVLVALAVLASATLATRPAASGVCDASCDIDCQTCCKTWTLQATCADGTVAGETGSYATPGDATTAAAAAPAPPIPCADGSTPTWARHCAAENAVASPLDTPAAASLVALTASLGQSLRALAETQQALADFAEQRIVLKAAFSKVAAVAAPLREERAALTEAMGNARQLRVRGSVTDGEVTALDEATADPRRQAADAVKNAQALMADPAIIDAPAEARRKALEDAAAAAKAARDAAVARAADEKRKREEAIAAAKALAEDRAEKAAAARSAALDKQVVTQQTTLKTSLDAAEASRAETVAALATFMARSDLTPAARTAGESLTTRVSDLQPKIAAQKTTVEGASSAPSDQAVRTLAQSDAASSGLTRDVARASVEAKALISSPKSLARAPAEPAPAPAAEPSTPSAPVVTPPPPPAPVVAPLPAGPAPLVPTCEVAFSSHATGVTLAVDRGQRVALPARIHVSSGRHTLSIQKGAAKSEKRELLLCGHLDAFPVEVP